MTAMRGRTVWMALCLAVAVVVPAVANAQQPVRQGIWGAVAGGYGTAKLGCSNCGDIAREGSFSGSLVVGGTLSSSLLFGLEVDGWVKTINNDPLRLGGLNAILQWYPAASLGLFIKGGVGLAYARGDLQYPTSVFVDDSGLGYLLGLGFDFPVGSGLAISPVASFYGGNIGDVQNAQGVEFTVFQLMVALTLQ